jgi:hydrogenase maturation protein HypF
LGTLETTASRAVGGTASRHLSGEVAGDLSAKDQERYPFSIEIEDRVHIVRLEPLFAALVKDLQSGEPISRMSARFHYTMAGIIVRVCQLIRAEKGLDTVALSGGCFQNRQLLRLVVEQLRAQGFHTLVHRQVPCNDGGLSLGQAVVAHFQTTGEHGRSVTNMQHGAT